MSKVKKGLSKKPVARAVLTDTVPYELPFYFTNYRLYQQLNSADKAHKLVEKILFVKGETRACKFHISKRPQGVRELSLMHPSAQAEVVGFYKKYDGFISQLCSRSRLSLRYPLRPASRYFDSRYRDDEGNDAVETDEVGFDAQSEFASSYFAYRRYSQVYKFFDSEEFIGLEQQFNCLLRVDISKCFASIYTHSISWAVRGKLFAKTMKSNRALVYFEDEFDKLMRNANWGETNGIIVGPEVSRIFSEIVLQGVDVQVLARMKGDVVIRRYMDDYFIFALNADAAQAAEALISEELEKFNLYLNEGKKRLEYRPLVSSLSIARLEVNEVCASVVAGLQNLLRIDVDAEAIQSDGVGAQNAGVSEGPDKLIRRIRTIAKQHGVEYSGLSAPALAVIGRKLNSIYSKISRTSVAIHPEVAPRIQRYLAKIIRVAEFLYLSDVRSSTSNKVARVFLEVADVCNKLKLGRSFVELQMLDVVRKAMNIWKTATLLDLVNAVVAVQLIASDGRGLERVDVENILARQSSSAGQNVNYLRTVLGIFLCSRSRRLASLMSDLTEKAIDSLSVLGRMQLEDASVVYLLLDLLACPHLDIAVRVELYRSVSKQLFSPNELSVADAKGELAKIARCVHFTNWTACSGDLRELRSLLRKGELRLAYD